MTALPPTKDINENDSDNSLPIDILINYPILPLDSSPIKEEIAMERKLTPIANKKTKKLNEEKEHQPKKEPIIENKQIIIVLVNDVVNISEPLLVNIGGNEIVTCLTFRNFFIVRGIQLVIISATIWTDTFVSVFNNSNLEYLSLFAGIGLLGIILICLYFHFYESGILDSFHCGHSITCFILFTVFIIANLLNIKNYDKT